MEEKSKTNEKALEDLGQKEEQTKNEIDSLNTKINDLKNDQTYKNQKNTLENKSQELESLKTTIEENEGKRDGLKAKLNELETKLENLKKDLGDKDLEKLEADKKAQKDMLAGLQNDLENNKASQSAKAKEIQELEATINTLKYEIEKIDTEIVANNKKISGLQNENQTTDNNIKAKEDELAKLNEKANNQPTNEEKAKAQAQWDKGSIGFFEENGSTDALNVFKELPAKKGYGYKEGTGKKYLAENKFDGKKIGENDSRSLDNMKQAIEDLKVVNAKRQSDKGIGKRELSVFGITDFDMAVAQANANYSSKHGGHATVYNPPYENLAYSTNPSVSEAITNWWDDEKELFDYLREKGCKSRNDMSAYVKNHPDELPEKFKYNNQIGHYTNLVDELMWKEDGSAYKPSVSAGYGINSGGSDFTYTKSIVLNPNKVSGRKILSIDEYQEKFSTYYNNLKAIINGGEAPLSVEDQARKKELEAEIKSLKDKKAAKEKEIEKLNAENKALNTKKSEQEELLNNNNAKLTGLNNELDDLVKEAKSLNDQISDTQNSINDLQSKIDSYTNDNINENEEITKVKGQITETQNKLTSINEVLDRENEKKTSIENEISSLNKSIKTQEDKIKKLTAQKDSKTSELTKLEEEKSAKTKAKEDLKQKIADLDEKIRENKTEEESLKVKNNEAQQNFADKSQAYNNAKASNDKLQADNKAYTGLKTKAEEAKKGLENAKESLEKAKEAKDKAAKNLEDARIKLIEAEANNKLAQNLDANNLDSLLDQGISVGAISAFRAAEENIKKLEEPIKEAKAKLDTSKKNLAEANEAYKKSLAKFNIAENDLKAFTKPVENKENEHPKEKDENQNLPTININAILTTKDEDEDKSEDPKVNKPSSLELLKLRQALLRNKTLIKAAELLLKIAPQRVADIKPQLLKIIKEAKELCKQAEKILATYNN